MDITIVSVGSIYNIPTRRLIAKTVNTLEKLGYKLHGHPVNLSELPCYVYTGKYVYDLVDDRTQASIAIKNAKPKDETIIRLVIGDGWKLLWI